jgi:hypothetical protein
LGNIFFVVDNIELSNKMTYVTALKVFVINTFFPSDVPCVAVERKYCRQFSVCVAPPRDTIYRLVIQFDEAGSVCDKRATG